MLGSAILDVSRPWIFRKLECGKIHEFCMELHHFVSWIYQTKNEFKILDLNIHTLVLQIPFSGDIKGSLKEHAQVIHKYLKDRIPGARLGQPTFPSTSD